MTNFLKIMNLGTLHLIPVPLAPEATATIPNYVQEKAVKIRHYFVENTRTARRFLKSFDRSVDIDSIEFSEVNNQVEPDLNLLKEWLTAGYEVGLMSEAGCPAVADPGSVVVNAAQTLGALVIPYVGPNSILMSLMASGFNGQQFRFIGYLPVKDPQRTKAIKDLEQRVIKESETQIFIETPYRNNQLVNDLIAHCKPHTKLCIALDITNNDSMIQTKMLTEWSKSLPDLHKRPTIFLLGQ